MGIHFWGGNSSERTSNALPPCAPTPDPIPTRFTILKQVDVARKSILLVHYSNCTTFDGKKLLLLDRLWKDCAQSRLDPHILGNGHPVIARFEPSNTGWKMAMICAIATNNT